MPKIQLPEKLHRMLTTDARIIVLIGGRGSGKSESTARVKLMKAQTEHADVLCGREFQNSIEDSVHKLFKGLISSMSLRGFRVTDKKIDCRGGGGFRFKGFARNSGAIKSAQDFKYSWIEEAQDLSQKSIDDLLPTIRAAGSKLFFTANPQSSADPFSKRFIVPYLAELNAHEVYEDDMHLIIKINWRDNPWFPIELEQQRLWDLEHMSRAKYDHIWEGEFNDSVEDALIQADWFDACIDAHLKLGFEARGLRMAAHDPSDEGEDTKGYALRHGSVIQRVEERTTGNVDEGCNWATGMALNDTIDAFTWDCDGMGAGLLGQVNQAFEGKHTRLAAFKGSEGPDFPDAVFEYEEEKNRDNQAQQPKTNKQTLKNKRAQYYWELRKRILNTYNAIERGVYWDPDKMISFSSEIPLLSALRSELCRIPVKPNANGLIQLYTKDEMKTKFKIKSPNLGDAVMMLMRQPHVMQVATTGMPQPIRPIGRR